MRVHFTIPGESVPWARTRPNKNVGVPFTPKKQRDFGAVIKDYGERAMGEQLPIDGPIELSVLCVYAWPKSCSMKKRALPGAEWKISTPDFDNLAKIIADNLQQICWTNDSRIASAHVWKKYGERPRVQIEWRTLS